MIRSTNSPTFFNRATSEAEKFTWKAFSTASTRRTCVKLSQPYTSEAVSSGRNVSPGSSRMSWKIAVSPLYTSGALVCRLLSFILKYLSSSPFMLSGPLANPSSAGFLDCPESKPRIRPEFFKYWGCFFSNFFRKQQRGHTAADKHHQPEWLFVFGGEKEGRTGKADQSCLQSQGCLPEEAFVRAPAHFFQKKESGNEQREKNQEGRDAQFRGVLQV